MGPRTVDRTVAYLRSPWSGMMKFRIAVLPAWRECSAAMQYYHDQFYPTGTSFTTKDYYGVNIRGPKYEEAASMVGGYAERVERPADLEPALREAYLAYRLLLSVASPVKYWK